MLKSVIFAILLIFFVCICRLAPHLANFSPMIFLSLFITRFFTRLGACILLLIAMLFSDLLLSIHSHYTAFGSWTWFTYSALLAIIYMGSLVRHLDKRFSLSAFLILGSSLGFWVWTNLGVWLLSSLYMKNVPGFMQCYIAAIPFLQHNLMSAYMWLIIFFGYQNGVRLLNLEKIAEPHPLM